MDAIFPVVKGREFVRVAAVVAALATLMSAVAVDAAALGTTHQAEARSAQLAVPVLHIVRVDSDGTSYETWTDAIDGLTKLVQKDGNGTVEMTSNQIKQPDGTFAATDVISGVASTRTLWPSGTIPEGFWFGGESSLAAMRAEYGGYLAHAPNVVRVSLNGASVRQFDMTSSDGIPGTIWLNDAGLPVQVEANHSSSEINRFLVIEELPAGTVSVASFAALTQPLTGATRAKSSR